MISASTVARRSSQPTCRSRNRPQRLGALGKLGRWPRKSVSDVATHKKPAGGDEGPAVGQRQDEYQGRRDQQRTTMSYSWAPDARNGARRESRAKELEEKLLFGAGARRARNEYRPRIVTQEEDVPSVNNIHTPMAVADSAETGKSADKG